MGLFGRNDNTNPAFTLAAYPDLEECEQMAGSGWSYRNFFYSYNPSGGVGSGEIAYMDGYYGQKLYIDKKADLVVVQQSVDPDYPARYAQSMTFFFALSMYF